MSKYSHKCCWCGKKFTEMSIPIMRQHLVSECKEWPGNKIVSQMTARNEELTSKLARMEALLDGAVQWVVEPDRENGHRCILCGATGNLIEEINHVAPCPVPYWLASKKEERMKCPVCNGYDHWHGCPTCHGTGRVTLFRWLKWIIGGRK